MIQVKENAYQYSKTDFLGGGTFGKVYKCIRTSDRREFALKTIDKAQLQAQGDYLVEALEREIATQTIATESGIPFFVGLYDTFDDDKTVYMVMELCEKSLTKHMTTLTMTEDVCLDFVYQIGLGLYYLHSIGITHRDIKTDNVLVKDGVLKIADFGFATKSSVMNTHLGTKPYMAPEFFLSANDEDYTMKIDVWALNTCLYFILAKNKYYFFSANPKEFENQIIKKEFIIDSYIAKYRKPTQDLLISGYIKDPKKRPTMKDYVNHPAFNEVRKKYLNYPPNSASFTPDLTFDNLKLEQRLSVEMGTVARVAIYFLNMRNNLIMYSVLARALQQKQFSAVFIFLLMKRHMQYLSMLILSFQTREMPTFVPFNQIQLKKDDWLQLTNSQTFKQLGAVFLSDLNMLALRLPQLYKNMLNANRFDLVLPTMDMNIDCRKELVSYSTNINDVLLNVLQSNKSASGDLEKITKMLQLILQYEQIDPSRLATSYNNVE